MMSQPSDVYASTSFEGGQLDALQYLVPDDTPSQRDSQGYLFSDSQFDLVPDLPDTPINRSRVEPSPPAPNTLPRIKPDRITEFIVCTPEISAEFVEWWLQTGFGLKKRINWDMRLQSSRADCSWRRDHALFRRIECAE